MTVRRELTAACVVWVHTVYLCGNITLIASDVFVFIERGEHPSSIYATAHHRACSEM